MIASSRRIRVLHCITSLDADGAQHMLLKLCQHMSSERFEHLIVNLREATPFAERFAELDVQVTNLGMRRAVPSVQAIRALASEIDRYQPDVIQGWMYHGNLAALAGRRWSSSRAALLWNIRKAVSDVNEYRPVTRLTLRAGAMLSGKVNGIIYCGGYISSQHLALGFSRQNAIIIPNGFDTERFQPSPQVYRAVRSDLSLAEDAQIVGMTARFHPHKDHANFFGMAAILKDRFPKLHFVLAGRGLVWENSELADRIRASGIADRVHLLGEHPAVEKLLPAFDVYCQSSSAEGFPNALGEAMSCGVPCVTTDAGASSEAVGDVGVVVPVGDSVQLASGVETLLNLSSAERRALAQDTRSRICDHFSLPAIAAQYEACYAWAIVPETRTQEVVYA